MNMIPQVTEFFEFIYEATRIRLPSFLVERHNFKVRYVLRDMDHPEAAEVLALEMEYGEKLEVLAANYDQVVTIMTVTPEPLHPAMLTVLGGSVAEMLGTMGLDEDTKTEILGELDNVLDGHGVTPEQLQQAGAMLAQIQAAQNGTPAPADDPPTTEDPVTDDTENQTSDTTADDPNTGTG